MVFSSLKKLLLIGIIIFTGCNGPKYFQKKLNKKTYPLGYLYDSPKHKENKVCNVNFEIVNSLDSNIETSVKVVKRRNLFLVFYSEREVNYEVRLGQNSVAPSLEKFIGISLVEEAKRSAKFNIDTNSKIGFQLQVEIVESKAVSEYSEMRTASGYQSSHTVNVRPANCILVFNAKLKDCNGNTVLEKVYKSNKTSSFVLDRLKYYSDAKKFMMLNLSEVLSLCVKDNIANIVRDINDAI